PVRDFPQDEAETSGSPEGSPLGLSGRASSVCLGLSIRSARRAVHVEFDLARQFDDGFGMMTVLKQRVFESFCAADEQAAIKAVLFLGNPVAPAVLADKDDGRCRIARWGFDEFHFCIPSCDQQDLFRSRTVVSSSSMWGMVAVTENPAWPPNIFCRGYEFEIGG